MTDAPTISPQQFLKRIWRLQRTDGSAFITWFDADHEWQDTSLRVIEQAPDLPSPLPNDGVDLYFAPCIFTDKRRKPHALPGRWLYADLDEVDPRALHTLKPTIAWETSPGRYQAMWLLKKPLPPDTLSKLNQKVTYFTEADKGGWSLTKVLRIPGTVSHKRETPAQVKLLWMDTSIKYDAKTVYTLVKGALTPPTAESDIKDLKLPKTTPSRILRRHKVSARIRKMYKAKEARGDRSQRLWLLENLLLKAGLSPEETLIVVRATVWNKYQGQRREIPQLWTEINKASAQLPDRPKQKRSTRSGKRSRSSTGTSTQKRSRKRSTKNGSSSKRGRRGSKTSRSASSSKRKLQQDLIEPSSRSSHAETGSRGKRSNGLALTGYNDFLGKHLKKPGWLVEGIWSEQAHGVLAGEAKAYKSVVSTDLAVSVASGTPFLGAFNIPTTGPVIMIQEENDEGETQDRLRRIAYSRGLTGAAKLSGKSLNISGDSQLPISLLNNTGFDLSNNDHLLRLAVSIKATGAALVILDPFYLMTPGIDENSAHQVGPILRKLLKIKQKLNCGVLLIHHYRKQAQMNPIHGAARISGTGVFHRWFESAVMIEKDEKQADVVRMHPEHRGHRVRGGIRVRFDLGTDQDLYYAAHVKNAKADEEVLHERLKDLLEEKEDWTMSELRVAMGLSNSQPLKYMLREKGYRWKKVKTGKRGRPKFIITPHT